MNRRVGVLLLLVVACVLLAGRVLASLAVDYMWFASMDAAQLWRARLLSSVILVGGTAILGFLFTLANSYTVRRSVVSVVLPKRLGNIDFGVELPGRYLTFLAVGASAVVGLLLAIPSRKWVELFRAWHGELFGEVEHYFQYDMSFYVNWLPFEHSLFVWALILLALNVLLVLLLYALTPSLRWERGGGLHMTMYVRRHLSILAAVSLVVLAWSFRLDTFQTLLVGSGIDGAFTYTDHKVTLTAGPLLTLATLVTALVVAWSGWTDQVRLTLGAILAIVVLSLVTSQLLPTIIRQSAEHSDPVARERPYLSTRAGYTRRAFAVDDVLVADPQYAFTFSSWNEAVDGVSVWDAVAFEQAVSWERAGAGIDGDVGYARAGGEDTQQTIYAVSRPAPGSSGRAAAWGVVRALSGRTDPRGAPRGPGRQGVDMMSLRQVLVTEPAPDYLIAPDTSGRIAAPAISGRLSRLVHAWSMQNFRILFSDLPHPNPRLVGSPGVRDRITRLAPFFSQGAMIVPVLNSDSLFWVVNLYSASSSYPLSHRVYLRGSPVSYLRHAATALVNASSGAVRLVLSADPDPMTETWSSRFPRLFVSRDEVAPALAEILPPAVDEAVSQAASYARYGSRRDSILGGTIPIRSGGDSLFADEAYPLIHLPAFAPSPAAVIPILDSDERISGAMIAVGGESPQTYQLSFPPSRRSWPEILRALEVTADSIRNESASELSTGRPQVVPLAGRLGVIMTTYLLPGAEPPNVTTVTVLDRDMLRTGSSLASAAGVTGAGAEDEVLDPIEFRARVTALYEAMRDALRRVDLAAFDEAFNALGDLLGRVPR